MPTQIPQKRFENPLVKPAPNNINPERKEQIKKENQQYPKVISRITCKIGKVTANVMFAKSIIEPMFQDFLTLTVEVTTPVYCQL